MFRVMETTHESPLRRVRKARKLTLRQLAAIVSTSAQTIMRLEIDGTGTPEIAERIADYFGRELLNEIHILYPKRFMKEKS